MYYIADWLQFWLAVDMPASSRGMIAVRFIRFHYPAIAVVFASNTAGYMQCLVSATNAVVHIACNACNNKLLRYLVHSYCPCLYWIDCSLLLISRKWCILKLLHSLLDMSSPFNDDKCILQFPLPAVNVDFYFFTVVLLQENGWYWSYTVLWHAVTELAAYYTYTITQPLCMVQIEWCICFSSNLCRLWWIPFVIVCKHLHI